MLIKLIFIRLKIINQMFYVLSLGVIIHMLIKSYSYFKESTGLAIAARNDFQPTVIMAINVVTPIPVRKIDGPIVIL